MNRRSFLKGLAMLAVVAVVPVALSVKIAPTTEAKPARAMGGYVNNSAGYYLVENGMDSMGAFIPYTAENSTYTAGTAGPVVTVNYIPPIIDYQKLAFETRKRLGGL